MIDFMHPGLRMTGRVALVALMLGPLAVGFARQAASGDGTGGRTTLQQRAAGLEAAAGRRTVQQVRPLLGIAINAHHISDLPLYLESVDQIAASGANALVLLSPGFQQHVDSDQIEFRPRKCATDEQLIAILRRAKERGLHTTLLPIVLIEHAKEKEWRGVIEPRNWDRWWSSYHAFIDRFVHIASAAEVDLLAMGSELNSTEEQIGRWRHVAERIRAGFDGQITYAANWDRFEKVTLWDLVDVISVSAYFELLRDQPGAPEEALVQAWIEPRTRLLRFARRWQKPLLLTEVGYPSLPWANAHPWNYVADTTSQADHEAQARCWRVFFTAWSDAFTRPDGPAAGFCCYHWDPYHHGQDTDTGYGIDGKPALEVIREGFARIRRAAARHAPAEPASGTSSPEP